MAVAFVAKPTAWNSADGLNQQTDNGTTCSASTGFAVGASANCLVGVAFWQKTGSDTGAASSWTWNGVSRLGILEINNAAGGTDRAAIAWWTASGWVGTPTLALTIATTADLYMSCASFSGVDTTTPVVTGDNVSGTTGTTVTITSDASGATIASWGTNGSTPTTNFNKIYAEAPLDPGAGASYQIGGTSNGHTFTGAGGTQPAWVGIHIQASAGGATTESGDIASDGAGVGTLAGASDASSAFSSDSASTMVMAGAARAESVLSADGVGDLAVQGTALLDGAISSDGAATVVMDATSVAASPVASDGRGDAQLDPASIAAAPIVSDGQADVQLATASLAASPITSDGQSTADLVGSAQGGSAGDFTADGTAEVNFDGASTAYSALTADGSALVEFVAEIEAADAGDVTKWGWKPKLRQATDDDEFVVILEALMPYIDIMAKGQVPQPTTIDVKTRTFNG